MSPSTDPTRDPTGKPTVREIAALTARLRDLSARGRDVDPAERAAFLADKDALIDRILTDTHTDAAERHERRARTGAGTGSTDAQVERAHQATAGLPPAVAPRLADDERREQLTAWHADDQAADDQVIRSIEPAVDEREWRP